jgi:hypothetical protein
MGEVFATLMQVCWNLFVFCAKGGLVMIPLVVSSLLALTVIIERFCFWRYLRKQGVARRF